MWILFRDSSLVRCWRFLFTSYSFNESSSATCDFVKKTKGWQQLVFQQQIFNGNLKPISRPLRYCSVQQQRSIDDSDPMHFQTTKFALTVLVCLMINAIAHHAAGQETTLEFRSLANEVISSPPKKGYLVLCFLGIECPLAKLYAPRINSIASEFSERGFRFVAINSNRQDSTQEWREFAKSNRLSFPISKDHNNLIANQLNVTRNPEVIVIDSGGEIVYRGRVDDQYSPGIVRSKVTREDLKLALTEISEGKRVSVPVTQPEGCLIGRVKRPTKNATVTYSRDIAPIFKDNCVECHRTGEIGPFAMEDYDEVVGWADMILETVENGRMPPWHADPTVGSFANSRGLSDKDKKLIRTWVDEGAQLGDPNEMPEPNKYTTGWRLPKKPDVVISMRDRPFKIPADGTVDYQYFVVDPGFKEDKWVSAAEIIPGNRAVVHHSIVFIRPPDGKIGFGMNWLEAYVPGQVPFKYIPSRARKIAAGSKLVFQQHYTPNGQPAEDLTKIGLVFVDEQQVKEELITLAAINQEFEIQPNDANVTVKAEIPWLPSGGKLLSASPHIHYRGKSFVAKSVDDGSKKTILHVPNYDFNWQHIYEFQQPLALKDMKAIEVEISFDNSEANPFNPDPDQYVVWGDQTWEEMAVGFFNVSILRQSETRKAESTENVAIQNKAAEKPVFSASTLARAKEYARQYFEKNDANNDGKLVADEVQLISKRHFSNFDTNRDNIVTLEEVEASARSAYHSLESRQK